VSLSESTRAILSRHGFTPKKKLGQNFIIDQASLDRIVSAGALTKDDTVLEIGTGLGSLTRELSKRAGRVISVEYDKVLFRIAAEELRGCGNVELVRDDFLRLDLKKLKLKNYKAVANLPYYITAPIITRLIEAKPRFELAVVTVQREVGERIAASPGGKEYGTLSVYVQHSIDVKISCHIPKSAFFPHPAVSSSVLVLAPRKTQAVRVKSEKTFHSLFHAAFEHRRKTLRNSILVSHKLNISKERLDRALKRCGIDGERRGETLSIDEFARLSNAL